MLAAAAGPFLASVWVWALKGVLIGTMFVLFLTALKRAIRLIDHPISKDFSVCTYWILAAGGLIASAGIFHLGVSNPQELLRTVLFSAAAVLPFGWIRPLQKNAPRRQSISTARSAAPSTAFISALTSVSTRVYKAIMYRRLVDRQAEAYLGYPEVGYIEVDSTDASTSPKVTTPYMRMFPHHLGDQAITQLASHYSYSRSSFNFPETYALERATITVTDLSDHSIIATTSFVYDTREFRFCGAVQNGPFSACGFLYRVLGLSKSYYKWLNWHRASSLPQLSIRTRFLHTAALWN